MDKGRISGVVWGWAKMAEKCLTPSHDQNSKSWSKVCSGMLWDRVRRPDHDLTSLGVCRGVRVASRRLFARLRTYLASVTTTASMIFMALSDILSLFFIEQEYYPSSKNDAQRLSAHQN